CSLGIFVGPHFPVMASGLGPGEFTRERCRGAILASATQPKLVWRSFGSWIRTIRPGLAPSEQVVAVALRNTLPEFLATSRRPGGSSPDLRATLTDRRVRRKLNISAHLRGAIPFPHST